MLPIRDIYSGSRFPDFIPIFRSKFSDPPSVPEPDPDPGRTGSWQMRIHPFIFKFFFFCSLLDDVDYVGTTADCWTAHHKAYLGMTLHWINKETRAREPPCWHAVASGGHIPSTSSPRP